ncbi:hypothetical protein VTN77DRAFT_7775 [Rasamsonia byssochlamydoides]|uniref:uncharacterized protein n=1 Tax=Rasamsonia byssochlamydoides TaxID=89139 RepID=UPI00374434F2
MTKQSDSYDYVICGGGTTGCVLASRLSHAGHTVLLIETGPEDYNEQIMSPPGLGGRVVPNYAGKLLSGSSAVNYGLWDKTQTHHDPQGSPDLYSFDGPIATTAGARHYPLRETIYNVMTAAGLEFNPDANGGNPFGFGAGLRRTGRMRRDSLLAKSTTCPELQS